MTQHTKTTALKAISKQEQIKIKDIIATITKDNAETVRSTMHDVKKSALVAADNCKAGTLSSNGYKSYFADSKRQVTPAYFGSLIKQIDKIIAACNVLMHPAPADKTAPADEPATVTGVTLANNDSVKHDKLVEFVHNQLLDNRHYANTVLTATDFGGNNALFKVYRSDMRAICLSAYNLYDKGDNLQNSVNFGIQCNKFFAHFYGFTIPNFALRFAHRFTQFVVKRPTKRSAELIEARRELAQAKKNKDIYATGLDFFNAHPLAEVWYNGTTPMSKAKVLEFCNKFAKEYDQYSDEVERIENLPDAAKIEPTCAIKTDGKSKDLPFGIVKAFEDTAADIYAEIHADDALNLFIQQEIRKAYQKIQKQIDRGEHLQKAETKNTK